MKITRHRTLFYCVIQPDGAFCIWSMARNREASWNAFLDGLGYSATGRIEAKAQYQKEGCRCVAVRLTLEEGKKKQ